MSLANDRNRMQRTGVNLDNQYYLVNLPTRVNINTAEVKLMNEVYSTTVKKVFKSKMWPAIRSPYRKHDHFHSPLPKSSGR